MDSKQAMKAVLEFLFELLSEEKGREFKQGEIEKAVEAMHDDPTFLWGLLNFLEEHIEIFGESYGLS